MAIVSIWAARTGSGLLGITGDLEPFDMAIVGGTFPDSAPFISSVKQLPSTHSAGGG